MIVLDPKQIIDVVPSDTPGKLAVTFEVDSPIGLGETPVYPTYNHTREDGFEDPCPECRDGQAACDAWEAKAKDMLDNRRAFMTISVTGYSLMGQSYTSRDATGAKEADFNAWSLSIEFPNGDLGQVLLPTKYQDEFNRELNKALKRNEQAPKSAWDRLLEDK